MKKLIIFNTLILLFVTSISHLSAQDLPSTTKDRYIKIENADVFFNASELDQNLIECRFELCNIFEDESSKPIFVDVNELESVADFTIKSRSERYVNQRSCYLVLNKSNYISVFKLVLDRMKVNYILSDDEFITADEFCNKMLK